MNVLPKVTAVVPSYNHGKFLSRRLESILNQTYKNIELIIVDDCSNDDSDSIIQLFLQKHSFRYIRNSRNSGSPFTAWETAASLATGKYIWICESDDYAEPSFLEVAVSMMEKDSTSVLFYCDSQIVDEDGTRIDHTNSYFHNIWKLPRWDYDFTSEGTVEMTKFQLFGQTVPNMSSALISTAAFRRAYNPFLKKLKLTGDWLFIGWLMRYGNVVYCKKTLNHFRSHKETSRVRVNSARSQAEFIMTKYLIFRQAKKPLRELANVVKTDAIRFLYESASAWDVIKALFHISVSKTISLGASLAVSISLNSNLLKEFYRRYKAIQKSGPNDLHSSKTIDSNASEQSKMAGNKNNILFIMAPKFDASMPPLSVPCLSAYLKMRGWNVGVYDLSIECYMHRKEKYLNHWNDEFQEFWNDNKAVTDFFNDHIDEVRKMFDFIEKEKPAYIGFSTHLANFCGSVILARKIKKLWPEIKIIFGGAIIWQKLHMGRLDLKDYAFIDAFVIGEGEAALHELLCIFKNGEDISRCPGVALFQNDKLQLMTPRNTIIPPKDLPMPDFTCFDLKKYTTHGKQLPLYLSRGCVNRCIFCEERKFWKTYRTKSGEQLFEEIRQAKEKYPDFENIYFSESLINGNINELRKLCLLLVEARIKVNWETNAVIRKEMDSDLLKLMAKAGCWRVMYGVESVSYRLLYYVGKVMSKGADIEKIVRDTAEAGIGVTLDFMFGLPGETEEDAQENINFVIRNKKYIYTIYPSWSFCYLTQLCDAYADPEKYGLKPITDVSFWESVDGSNTYPVRLERFERFCAAMIKEGITVQYPSDKLADREKKLGYYYCFKKDYQKAAMYLLQAVEKEPWDTVLSGVAKMCCQKVTEEM